MTSGQRKIHKLSWLLIAILGVIFLFFAIQSLSFDEGQSYDVKQVENAKPNASWV